LSSGLPVEDTLHGIENISAGSGADTFVLFGSAGHVIDGGAGYNTASYSGSTSFADVAVGSASVLQGIGDKLLNT
jgi:hypothetical protein